MALQQIILEHAVRQQLPSAFATSLERVTEFEVGKVLVLHKKPHFWRWGRQLDFTSLPLAALLKDVHFNLSPPAVLFTSGEVTSNNTATVTLNVGASSKLMKKVFLSVHSEVKAKENSIEVKFGAVDYVGSDLYQVLSDGQWRVNTNHPVVRDALQKGMEMYVISSVYQATKVDVKIIKKVTFDLKVNEEAQKSKTITPLSGSASYSPNKTTVFNRDTDTIIAFHVMKLTVNQQGQLTPLAKSGFHCHHKIHTPYGDSFVMTSQRGEQPPSTESATTPL